MTTTEKQPANPKPTGGNTPTPAQRRARKQFRKRLIWGVILAAIVVGGLLYWQKKQREAADWKTNLQTEQAIRATLLETVTATGMVNAQTGAQVSIGSQITGVIKHLYADVGSKVKAGQVIAALDVPDLQAQLGESQAQLDQAESKLQQARITLAQTQGQTTATLGQANAQLRNAQQNQNQAISAAVQQPQQTTSDILKARAGLDAAKVTLAQARDTRNSQIAASQDTVNQDQSNVTTTAATLARQKQLFAQGYVAATTVDTAQNQADVAVAQLAAAKQNLDVTRANVDASIQSASAGVATAQQALKAANLEMLTNQQKQEAANAAAATTQQQQQNVALAQAGLQSVPIAEKNILVDEQTVQQFQQQVDYQKALLARGVIVTPISGTVLQLAEQQGETIAAGLSAPTLIVVADLNRLQVDAFVDETDIGKVKLGQTAACTVDAFPDQKFAGTVVKIAAGATLQQNVVTYDVTIAIKDPNHQLLPTMTTNTTIDVGEHDEVVAVHNEGVKQLKAGKFVYLLPKDGGKPTQQPVETGATDGTYTEIKSGLDEGDTIVLAGWPPAATGNVTMTPFGARAGGGGGGGGGGRGGG